MPNSPATERRRNRRAPGPRSSFRVKRVCIFVALLALTSALARADDCNAVVLEQINKMPHGGRYSTSRVAKIRLQHSAHFESGNTSLARRLLQEAVELAVRGPQRARALLDLGMVVSAEEGWRQAVDVFTSALEEAGD